MESLVQRNRLTFTAIGVVALYIVLAITTHVVLLGIFPMLLAYRAFRRGEALAPVALVCGLVAVIVAVSALSHH